MTFFAELPPVEDRALAGHGALVLQGVAEAQRSLAETTPHSIARRIKMDRDKDGSRVAEIAHALETAGLLRMTFTGRYIRLYLTDKGREKIKANLQKPLALRRFYPEGAGSEATETQA